ncbi:MAG: AsmA family protein [Steroidobacteraceae bacterium]
MVSRATLLKSIATAVTLLVALLLFAWLSFDPNEYKDEAEAAFLERTGRTLTLEGDLSLSIIPWLAVETGAASISNREGFDGAPFASVQRARVSVRLLPLLLRREARIGIVEVDGLELRLQVARDGRDNWSDLLERAAKVHPEGTRPPGDEPRGPVDVAIAGLALENARVTLDDRKADTRYELRDWTLETGRLRAGRPFDLDTALTLLSGDAPLVRLDLETAIDASQAGRIGMHEINGNLVLPGGANRPSDVQFEIQAEELALEVANKSGRLTGLEARLGDALIEAELHGTSGKDGVSVRGPVSLGNTSPRKLLAALGRKAPDTRDAGALGRLEARGDLSATSRSLIIEKLTARLDDTRLEGSLGIADFERRALQFDLQVDQLDFDRYRAPLAADATEGAAGDAGDKPAVPLPTERLRKLDCNGRLRAGRLVFDGIEYTELALPVVARDGRVRIDRAQARAFGGRLWLTLAMDVTGETPALHIEPRLQDVDVHDLLVRTIGVQQLTGRGSVEAALDAAGADSAALERSLRGKFDLTVRDGTLIGADLWHEIERAIVVAQGKQPPAGSGTGRTDFDLLSGRGTLSNQTLHNDVFQFSTDFVRVKGRGDVNFGAQEVDLDLKARLLRTPPGRLLGVDLTRLEGADIPLTVTGPLASPDVKPNVASLLGEVVKKKVTRDLEKEVRKRLQDLLGN